MPLLLPVFFPYLLGIFLSFLFAEFSINFPDTLYLLFTLLIYIYLAFFVYDIKLTYSTPEKILFLLIATFLIVSLFWFFKLVNQGNLSQFIYPFLTVTFNLTGPYLIAKCYVKKKFNFNYYYLVLATILIVALWQYIAVNYIYNIEYLYFNERLKSSLFQGEARIPSIFVSANNFGVFLISVLAMLLCFSKISLKFILTSAILLIFLYLTFVRKTYILLILMIFIFPLLRHRVRFSSLIRIVLFFLFLALPFSFITLITDGKFEEGVMSSQTMGSRFYQWGYFIDKFIDGGFISYFFGDYTLQSSFENLGYLILFIDNNFLMSLTFGGIIFCLLQVTLIFSLILYFNSSYLVNKSWAIFGTLNVFAICWVSFFSNLIDNHEASIILYSAVWISLFKIREFNYGKKGNY